MKRVMMTVVGGLLATPSLSYATNAPFEGDAWYGDVGLTTLAVGRVQGEREQQWHATLEVDWAALVVAPTLGVGRRFLAGDVWALRAHASAAPLLLLGTTPSVGARADIGVVSEWRWGWGGLAVGPRLDGAMSLVGDDEARFQVMCDLGVGVNLGPTKLWLIASPGWALSRTGSDTLVGEVHLTLML